MKLRSRLSKKRSKKPNNPLNYALWLLTRRSRTRAEIEKKLREKARRGLSPTGSVPGTRFDEAEISAVISRLKDLGFIDDLKYANDYISSSSRFKPKGRRRLFIELIKKGVPKDLIEKALDEAESDQVSLASEALEIYSRRLKNLPREKKYQRSLAFLLRRGFSYGEAKKAVNSIQNKSE